MTGNPNRHGRNQGNLRNYATLASGWGGII